MDRYQQRYGDYAHLPPPTSRTNSSVGGQSARESRANLSSAQSRGGGRDMSPFSTTVITSSRAVGSGMGGNMSTGTTTSNTSITSTSLGAGIGFNTVVVSGSACNSGRSSPCYGSPYASASMMTAADQRPSKEWGLAYDAWARRRAARLERHPVMARTIRPALDTIGHVLERVGQVIGIVGSAYYKSLSPLQHFLIAFFILCGVTSFFIAYCMDSTQLAAFTVPAFHHGWNLRRKAKACRKAGLYYFILCIAVVFGPRVMAAFSVFYSRFNRGVKARLIERSRNTSRQQSGLDADRDYSANPYEVYSVSNVMILNGNTNNEGAGPIGGGGGGLMSEAIGSIMNLGNTLSAGGSILTTRNSSTTSRRSGSSVNQYHGQQQQQYHQGGGSIVSNNGGGVTMVSNSSNAAALPPPPPMGYSPHLNAVPVFMNGGGVGSGEAVEMRNVLSSRTSSGLLQHQQYPPTGGAGAGGVVMSADAAYSPNTLMSTSQRMGISNRGAASASNGTTNGLLSAGRITPPPPQPPSMFQQQNTANGFAGGYSPSSAVAIGGSNDSGVGMRSVPVMPPAPAMPKFPLPPEGFVVKRVQK